VNASVPQATNSHPFASPPGSGSINVTTNINETGLEVSYSVTQSLATILTSPIALQDTSLPHSPSLYFSDQSYDKAIAACTTEALGSVNKGVLEVDTTIAKPPFMALPFAAGTELLGLVKEGRLEVVPTASLPPSFDSLTDPFNEDSDDSIAALQKVLDAKRASKKKVQLEASLTMEEKVPEEVAKNASFLAVTKKKVAVLPASSKGYSSSEESVGSFSPVTSDLDLAIVAAFDKKKEQEAKLKAQQEAAVVRNEVQLMTAKKKAVPVAIEKKKKEERRPVPLLKKQPIVVAVCTKKKAPDKGTGNTLLGEVVPTMTNQTKGPNKQSAEAPAQNQKTNALQPEKRFVCQIHRQGYIDLTALLDLKGYLKSSATYDLSTLLTTSNCHICSKCVRDLDSCLYYCLLCKNEMCLSGNIEDDSHGDSMRYLPWLCEPCYVAEGESTVGEKKSTRKRKQTSKAQENY
jgi:hypothetical protein